MVHVEEFLNGLEDDYAELFNDVAIKVWENPEMLEDTRLVCLFGNSPAILYKVMYHLYGVKSVRKGTTEDVTYGYSDIHMEFTMTEESMAHIKSIVRNKTIDNKKFVFLIKQPCRRLMSLHKRFFEKQVNAVFVFAVSRLNSMASDVKDMCWCVNCSFPETKIREYLGDEFWEGEDFLNMLVRARYGVKQTKMETAIDRFLEMPLGSDNGRACRELAHQLYHLNVPFPWLAKYILRKWKGAKAELVMFAAEGDAMNMTTRKSILVFEQFLLRVTSLR